MSGICGQFNLDKAPVAEGDLRAMLSMLATRGPDARRRWQQGHVALGHALLATTAELEFEPQPFTHEETGCVITADVRLDYRSELLDSLGLIDDPKLIGDAELVLQSYLIWGEQCLDRLLGDFAFAIWDPRHQTLFCARDHFGMRPLYYRHVPGRGLLFASDARAILVLPHVPYRINEGRVADYLVPQLEWIDYTTTFFQGIYRLPPGHKLTVTPESTNIAEYWEPVPGPALATLSDEDYLEGFQECFSQAVAERLRGPAGSVGSMLSGGMDSGSIVAFAKELSIALGNGPLPTFSAVRHRGDDCAESKAIYSALSIPSVLPTLVHPEGVEDILEQLTSNIDEPFDGEFTILKAIYLAAQSEGRRTVLDGAGGDIVLGEGTYIVRLIRAGHLRRAFTEIAGLNKFWGFTSLPSDLLRYIGMATTPLFVKKIVRPFRNRRNMRDYLGYSIISEEFAKSVNIQERFEHMREIFPGNKHKDYATERVAVIRPNVSAGRERYGRLAAFAGTEARDPFLDKRVVDFCSRLPGMIRMKDGWPKTILREMTNGRLPDAVRWARGKPHLGSVFNAEMTRQAMRCGQLEERSLQTDLKGYVEPEGLARAWCEFLDGSDTQRLHSAYVLSLWLRQNERRPVVSGPLFG